MCTIKKVLNNNAIIVESNKNEELVVLHKGIGFNVKPEEKIALKDEYRIYTYKQRGDIDTIDEVYIEISSLILERAKQRVQEIDSSVLIPLADHIAFAIERIKKSIDIENPFIQEIPLLFKDEFLIALYAKQLIQEKLCITINDDEISYITLHIHNALTNHSVSESLEIAQLIKESLNLIEKECDLSMNNKSTTYLRLLNHMKYMIIRAKNKELLHLNMEEYIKNTYPSSYQAAQKICMHVEQQLNCALNTTEPGYLAIHIERIKSDAKKATN